MPEPARFAYPTCRLVRGSQASLDAALARFGAQPVDEVRLAPEGWSGWPTKRTTLAAEASVAGVGTFRGRERRTITFAPSTRPGWWMAVDIANLWTSARNLVLRSGSPHNYLRMVEHIVALRAGLGLDNVVLETNSGDPPLFDESSRSMVDAVRNAGIVETDEDATYVTVREPLAFAGTRGDFLLFLPDDGSRRLRLDVAINWRTIIGDQRVVFDVTPETFAYGAYARTNATHRQYQLAWAFGWLFADTRHLGYNKNFPAREARRHEEVPRAGVAPRDARPPGGACAHGPRPLRRHGGELPRGPHAGLRRRARALPKRPPRSGVGAAFTAEAHMANPQSFMNRQ